MLTTLLPDGQPHSCLVWVDHDGTCARANTTLQRQSGRDLAADPRVSLLIVDPDDTARFIQVRGVAELESEGAVEHLDALTRRYTRHPRFYGFVYPAEQAGARAAGHRAHPRPPRHARRHPRLKSGSVLDGRQLGLTAAGAREVVMGCPPSVLRQT